MCNVIEVWPFPPKARNRGFRNIHLGKPFVLVCHHAACVAANKLARKILEAFPSPNK